MNCGSGASARATKAKTSNDKDMKVDMIRNDEACLAVFEQVLHNKLLVLHSWSCWNREEHSCADLLEKDLVINDRELNTRHTDIGTVVMGDLSMAGCYVDWDAVKTIIGAGQDTA